VIKAVNRGILNSGVTATDLRNAEAIFGKSTAAIKGKTNMKAAVISKTILAARTVQVQQKLAVDIMFVMGKPFLVGLLYPLELGLVTELADRSLEEIGPKLQVFIATAASKGFDVLEIHTDGEKSIAAMKKELQEIGIEIEPSGPGQHIPQVERLIQTIKKRVRAHRHDLPFTMGKVLTEKCVLFCMSRWNMIASANSLDNTSPLEQFTGRKLDAKIDFRVAFGDYVQATNPEKTNGVNDPNTHGCIAVYPLGNSRGTVKMWRISTRTFVDRDQFTVLPMTDNIIELLNSIAKQDGYSRDEEVREDSSIKADDNNEIDNTASQARETTMQPIPPPSLLPTEYVDPLGAGVDLMEVEDANDEATIVPHETDLQHNEVISGAIVPQPTSAWVRRSVRNPREPNITLTVLKPSTACQEAHLLPQLLNEKVTLTKGQKLAAGKDIRSQLVRRSQWHDTQYAFKMSVKAAMKDRPEEARPVIMAEIQQMVDKGVWHGVHMRDLTKQERKAIIRSMFLKDKYFASGEFEKFKARLVSTR